MKSEFSAPGQSSTHCRLSDWFARLCKLAKTFELAEKRRNETRMAFIEADAAFDAALVTLQKHYRQLPDQRPMTNAVMGRINKIATAWLRLRKDRHRRTK